jgi:hypothetical protein
MPFRGGRTINLSKHGAEFARSQYTTMIEQFLVLFAGETFTKTVGMKT